MKQFFSYVNKKVKEFENDVDNIKNNPTVYNQLKPMLEKLLNFYINEFLPAQRKFGKSIQNH